MNQLRNLLFLFLIYAFISSCGHQQKINAYHFETNKRIEVKRGAVVSASPIASEVDVSI